MSDLPEHETGLNPASRRRKTRANYVIQRNLENRQSQGLPSIAEDDFNRYQKSRNLELEWMPDTRLEFIGKDRNGEVMTFDLQCDFLHPNSIESERNKWPGKYDYVIEIDGEKFHRKKNKEEWKDRLKNSYQMKVLHIPAVMTSEKWWPELDKWLPKALISKLSVERLDEYA